jgi:hypothetical protein
MDGRQIRESAGHRPGREARSAGHAGVLSAPESGGRCSTEATHSVDPRGRHQTVFGGSVFHGWIDLEEPR